MAKAEPVFTIARSQGRSAWLHRKVGVASNSLITLSISGTSLMTPLSIPAVSMDESLSLDLPASLARDRHQDLNNNLATLSDSSLGISLDYQSSSSKTSACSHILPTTPATLMVLLSREEEAGPTCPHNLYSNA